MKTTYFLLCWSIAITGLCAQIKALSVDQLPLGDLQPQTRTHYLLKMGEEGTGQAIETPVIVIRGRKAEPVLGIFAAIHGNEINGIQVIQKLVNEIDPQKFEGTLIAVPGLNVPALLSHQRKYLDQVDLNRIFPGKANGNRSQQYVHQITTKLLPPLDYLIDLHTASFGRENSLYVRGDMSDDKIAQLVNYQFADIYLNSAGPSAGTVGSGGLTMRAQAMKMGIPTITVEYGNPQVFQKEMISEGLLGLKNTLREMKMYAFPKVKPRIPVYCSKSYWLYTTKGGYLEVLVKLKQQVKKDEAIAVLRDPFGQTKETYHAPEDGIVIGRSSNPISDSGGRIIHLGILKKGN